MKTLTTIKALALLSLPVMAVAQTGRSYTPIIGYDDKNGALYGAAAFLYDEGRPGFNAGLYGVSNGSTMHALTFTYEQRQAAGLDFAVESHLTRGFDQYYGEGSATPSQPLMRLDQDRADLKASALLNVDGHWSAGPVASLRARRQSAVKDALGQPLDAAGFANAASPALGFKVQYDDRDSNLSSTKGGLMALEMKALPSKLAAGDGASDAYLASAELRQFHSLGHVVLASRVAGGASLGTPGYLDRYSLGGTSELRGFQDNRFRGGQYYVVQQELRAPIWKMISVAGSVDLGQAGDGALLAPRKSAQAGVRVGLPPSYGMQARLDSGWGDGGERSLMLQFGQTF